MKNWMILWLFPFLLQGEIEWTANTSSPFSLILKISSENLQIGEELVIELKAEYPSSYQFEMASVAEQLAWTANPSSPNWYLSRLEKEAILNDQADIKKQGGKVYLVPLKAGKLALFPSEVKFEHATTPLHMLTPPFEITVSISSPLTVSYPVADLIPLEPEFPLELSQRNRDFLDSPLQLEQVKKEMIQALHAHTFPFLQLFLILFSFGFGACFYRLQNNRRNKESPIGVLMPQKGAEEALQSLHAQHLLEKEQVNAYVVQLSAIIFDFLQKNIPEKARAKTAPEWIAEVKQSYLFSVLQKEKLIEILSVLDHLKFSGKPLSKEEALSLTEHFKKFLKI